MLELNAPIDKIVILAAMHGEADPIIAALDMKQKNAAELGFSAELGLNVYHVMLEGKDIYLVQNGRLTINGVVIDKIGTQMAAAITLAVILTLKPDTLISAGTAGGFRAAAIGDVFVCDQPVVYHDRRIGLAGYDVFGEGRYECMNISRAASELGLKVGVLSTGSSLDASETDISVLTRQGANVVDMEGAAVAEIANMFGVRVVMVKSVTNYIDKDMHSDFVGNYAVAVGRLAEKVDLLVRFILGKRPSELL